MNLLPLVYTLLSVTTYGFLLVMLARFQRFRRGFRLPLIASGSLPGISVLLPVKGVFPEFERNFRGFLAQRYEGPLEIIFGVRDENDPVLPIARRLADEAAAGSGIPVRFAIGGRDAGLNPKNSNLLRAFRESTHPWLYCGDLDMALAPQHLRRCLEVTGRNSRVYATSMTCLQGARTLGAQLEAVGANFEGALYFLGAWLKRPNDSMCGASMFIHRDLLARAGGFEASLNRLTDDLFLGRALTTAGGEGRLAPGLVRGILEEQTVRAFWTRLVRWILIARHFRPELFWVAPVFWIWQWLAVSAAVTGSASLLKLAAFALGIRLLAALITQIALGVPRREWQRVLALIPYDCLAPCAWTVALWKSRVQWAGNTLRIRRHGILDGAGELR